MHRMAHATRESSSPANQLGKYGVSAVEVSLQSRFRQAQPDAESFDPFVSSQNRGATPQQTKYKPTLAKR